MTDYHQRFRERFVAEDGSLKVYAAERPQLILAFIDEVVAEERNRPEEINVNITPFVEQGRKAERAALIQKVERMRKTAEGATFIDDFADRQNYNQALDDLLTYLRGEEKPEFMECDTCRAKAGSPILCKGCLHNRTLVDKLKPRPESPKGATASTEQHHPYGGSPTFPKETECCEKCGHTISRSVFGPVREKACANRNCPCHNRKEAGTE